MIYQYIVTLKRGNDRYIDGFNVLLCAISVLAFGITSVFEKKSRLLILSAAIILAAGLAGNLWKSVNGKGKTVYRYLLFFAGIGWIVMPVLQWMSLFFFLLSFLEYQAKYPLEIGFTDQEVTINNLFRKKHPWSHFNNILLKDGLLTLDFSDNTLFQREAIDEEEGEADEEEFNAYCQKKIEESAAGI